MEKEIFVWVVGNGIEFYCVDFFVNFNGKYIDFSIVSQRRFFVCFFGIYGEVISKNDYYMGYFWFSNVFDEFDFFYEMYGIFCVGIFCMIWEIVNSFLKFWEC